MRRVLNFKEDGEVAFLHIIEYCAYAVVIGAVIGFGGTYLGKAINLATEFRLSHEWVIYLLPIAGLAIVGSYKLSKIDQTFGANRILITIRDNDSGLPFIGAPLIFIATVLTHLCGGSAGRESAALILGASLAGWIGRRIKFKYEDMRIITMCGMAAGFTSLFGTPFTACLFSLEILANKIRYAALLPVILACMSSYFFSNLFGAEFETYTVANMPEVKLVPFLQICLLGVLAACVSAIMCIAFEKGYRLANKAFKNPYLRIFVGGIIVAGITLILGPEKYAGLGTSVIEGAIAGTVPYPAFAIKILLSALTLGFGFKGGEIVPTLYVGATFGCLVGPLIGCDPGLAAAVCMMGVFAGNTNCPLATIALACEIFGGKGLLYFVTVIIISYTLSGNYSLYSGQKLMKSRFSID